MKKNRGQYKAADVGKVRRITPKVKKTGVNARPKQIPRVRYRQLHHKYFVNNGYRGQIESIGANKYFKEKKDDLIILG